jgi:hypothetical protein
MGETPSAPTLSTTLQQLAEQVHQSPAMAFTTLAHLIDVDLLREAYRRTRKDGAPGIDGVTAQEYAEHLEANLANLHERLRSGRYRAPPVRRTYLDKEDGSQRPIGIPAFEDKIVERAVKPRLKGRCFLIRFADDCVPYHRALDPFPRLGITNLSTAKPHEIEDLATPCTITF